MFSGDEPKDREDQEKQRPLAISTMTQVCALEASFGPLGTNVVPVLGGEPRVEISDIPDKNGSYLIVNTEVYTVKTEKDTKGCLIPLPDEEFKLFDSYMKGEKMSAQEEHCELGISVMTQGRALEASFGPLGTNMVPVPGGEPRVKISDIPDKNGIYLIVNTEVYTVMTQKDMKGCFISLPNEEFELFEHYMTVLKAGKVSAINAFNQKILNGLTDHPHFKQDDFPSESDGTIETSDNRYYNDPKLNDLAMKWKKTYEARPKHVVQF
ncbi:hypothetical protein MMC14_010565 [Varicellaria rhodocarpa]|nr:hypothetical protein [Varicellaria rhodocarpa]